jgi:LacI family transcriptional regulator
MPTIRDIAGHLGLSKSAVSLALQESERIPETTRARVREAAQALGYRPNPVFTQMMRAVRHSGPVRARAILGILHGFSDSHPERSIPFHGEWVAGARERAEALGYVVDEIWMTQPGMSARRLGSVLHARGIASLVIAPLPEKRRIELDWSRFSAVTAGLFLLEPRLSRVVPNHQQAMLLCLQKLQQRGYRRIGFVLEDWLDDFAAFHFMSPFLWFQHELPAAERVPVFAMTRSGQKPFNTWYRKHRPEAVILTGSKGYSWLIATGARVPAETGVVFTQSTGAPANFCSVDEQARRLGAAAIDLVLSEASHGERGVPINPKTVFTEVAWRDGVSLRETGPAISTPNLTPFF